MDKKIESSFEQITREFNRLEKFGFKIFSFNNKNLLSFGLKYFVNHIIVSKRYLVFIEVKQDIEIVSDERKEFQLSISHLSSLNKSLHYRVIRNLNDCRKLIQLIITNKL